MAWQKTGKKYEKDIEKLKLMLERVEELKKLTAEKMKISSEKGYSKDKEKERINAMQTLDEKIVSIKKKLNEIEKNKTYKKINNETIIIKTIKPKNNIKKAVKTIFIQEENKNAIVSENNAREEISGKKRNKKELKLTDSDINSLKKSIDSLNSANEGLIKLFSEANKTLYDDTEKMIISKLDKIIEQNNKIQETNERLAEAILSMAEMLNQSIHNVTHNKQQNNIEKLPFSSTQKKQADDNLSMNIVEKVSHKEIRQIFSSDRNEQMKDIKNKIENYKAGKTFNESKPQQIPQQLFGNQPKPNLPESWEKEIDNEDQNLKPMKKRPLKLNVAPRPSSFFGGDDSPSNTLSSFD